MTNEEKTIQRDRMRFTKNKFSSNLVYLAILADVFFFVSIYKSDVGTYYYNILIGASIIYNLVFMLAAFLSSEGVKNYNITYSYVLLVLGVVQIIRIFIIPVQAHSASVTVGDVSTQVMGNGQFVRVVAYLLVSAACCLVSAVVGITRARALNEHVASLGGTAAA